MSFRVIYFGTNEKQLRDYGLVCESSGDIASERSDNCRFDEPTFIYTPSPATPANIRINLFFPETRISGLI